MRKVNYINLNPVRGELVKKMDENLYSSVRIWQRKSLGNVPLEMDINQIKWREAEPLFL